MSNTFVYDIRFSNKFVEIAKYRSDLENVVSRIRVRNTLI